MILDKAKDFYNFFGNIHIFIDNGSSTMFATILLLKGDPRSPFKSKIPPLLGKDLGGLCTGEVISE